jgi:hypothetical protein
MYNMCITLDAKRPRRRLEFAAGTIGVVNNVASKYFSLGQFRRFAAPKTIGRCEKGAA